MIKLNISKQKSQHAHHSLFVILRIVWNGFICLAQNQGGAVWLTAEEESDHISMKKTNT